MKRLKLPVIAVLVLALVLGTALPVVAGDKGASNQTQTAPQTDKANKGPVKAQLIEKASNVKA